MSDGVTPVGPDGAAPGEGVGDAGRADRASPVPRPEPPPRGSTALRGRERIVPSRPHYAGTVLPDGRIPLPVLVAESAAGPATRATHDRMVGQQAARSEPGWTGAGEQLRERGAAIRRETLGDLEGYLGRLAANVEANGGVVHRAATPAEGARIVSRIAHDNGVRLIVKSKSMATEELHLNRHLEQQGFEVVETDLGEYIVQLADERPSHIVAPAAHKSREDVTALFSQLAGEPVPDEPDQLAAFARARLREDFRHADMGISGVNFAAADTGTLTIVTNEGNGRMVTSQPRVHVAVMTAEKVIPRFTDLAVLLPLLTHAATRQNMTVYETMLTGPRRPGERDGPEQLHLVILDNGRTRIAAGKYREVLACIRCGACQGACPVYRTVGGHGYGAIYGGPIGAVLTPLLGGGDRDRQLPFLSSLCGNCYDVCPVKIPLPDMLVDLRADYEAGRARLAPGHLGWRLWATLWSSPAGYRVTLAAVRLAGRLVGGGLLARLPGPGRGWAQGRRLPPLDRAGALRRWLARRGRPRR